MEGCTPITKKIKTHESFQMTENLTIKYGLRCTSCAHAFCDKDTCQCRCHEILHDRE